MRYKEPSTSIIFVRHGITDYPEDRIYKGDNGPVLNEDGRSQAENLGTWIKGNDVAAVLVSPSTRTRETAAPIVKSLGIEYKTFDELKERCFGVWDGLTFREIEEKYPEGLSRWKADQASYTPEGGESIYDFQKRVDNVLQWAIQEYKGKKVVIVSHTGPIRVAVTQSLKIPLINYRQLQIHPGSATRVDFGNSSVNLIYLSYLPGGNKV